MNLSSNTILITGGASGIGYALAERFLEAGNEVIICGRRESKLQEAKQAHPELHARIYDVSKAGDREALIEWVSSSFPKFNVLVNNAGIQRRFRLKDPGEWKEAEEEIAINFDAAVHLSLLCLPHFLKQQRPAILNVTSGLAFVPMASAPIYCATKAALRSFTLSLRYQLAKTPIEVVEIIPPSVQTDLSAPGLHTTGVPVHEFADAVIQGLNAGASEITYGFSEKTSHASRSELEEVFRRMNPPAV